MGNATPVPVAEDAIDRIEALVAAHDTAALQEFIEQNDALLAGEQPLAVALRQVGTSGGFAPVHLNCEVAGNNGNGTGRAALPWDERPGQGRKSPPPNHPHIYSWALMNVGYGPTPQP